MVWGIRGVHKYKQSPLAFCVSSLERCLLTYSAHFIYIGLSFYGCFVHLGCNRHRDHLFSLYQLILFKVNQIHVQFIQNFEIEIEYFPGVFGRLSQQDYFFLIYISD